MVSRACGVSLGVFVTLVLLCFPDAATSQSGAPGVYSRGKAATPDQPAPRRVEGAPLQRADLLGVYQLALARDSIYATARSAWAAAQEKIPQGRALLLPELSASANVNHNDREIAFRNNTNANDRFNSGAYNIAVTQPIFRMQNLTQYAQAKLIAQQADAQVAASANDLVLRVSQAYFDVLLTQDAVEVAEALKTAIGRQLSFAKLNFDLGVAVSTDVHEAQARYDLVASQEIAARNELFVRRRALNTIIGVQPAYLVGAGIRFRPEPPQPNDLQHWLDIALSRSPQIAAQRLAVEIATEEIERYRYGHYPTVDAVASYGKNSAGSGILGGVGYDITNRAVGVQVAVPLYQGGAVSARVREAAANQQRAQNELDTTSRQVAFAVEQAFSNVATGISQIRALRSVLDSADKQLQSTLMAQREGVRTSIDVLNAQQQFFQARKDVTQAHYAYLFNRLRLSATTGGIDESELRAVNRLLVESNGTAGPTGGATAPLDRVGAMGADSKPQGASQGPFRQRRVTD